jgi:hypothetical protein
MSTKADVGFDDAPSGYSLVPAGQYAARLESVTEELSVSSGNPMLVWDWGLVGGDFHGKELRSWTSLMPKAIGIGCREHFAAFGGRWDAGDIIIKKAKAFQGKKALINIVISKRRDSETGEEKSNNKIDHVLPAMQSQGTPAAAAASAAAVAPPVNDEDIPF